MTTHSIIITTCATQADAEQLAQELLGQKLAACIQVLPITSYYSWKGKIANEAEHLLFIKTKSSLYAEIEQFIRAHHTYETPEIIQVPISQGLPAYLEWIDNSSK